MIDSGFWVYVALGFFLEMIADVNHLTIKNIYR